MKIFIGCSKYFYSRVNEIKSFLEAKGHEITLPNCFDNPFEEEQVRKVGAEEHMRWKCKMMKTHGSNIKKQDAILILNFEKNGIPNYIGGATFMEVIKAWEFGKKIFFYNPLPNCSFTDELKGMSLLVINENLDLIK
ncbi:hypothetical protein CMI37_37905 [Candidatus Pacearchaeota archaeon]|nr:hypothetical protein [Candidatus Pacearchaeota archaeon]|tara:strand:- start:1629 stop:2039 length:411 start_codon:yes stop_codon:yes gene_type:complete